MPPASVPSTTPAAAVRGHFGLTQAELARSLGVSPGQVAHLEAGRRRLPALLNLRLVRLARLLPPPEGSGPPGFGAAPTPLPRPMALFEALPVTGPLAAGPLIRRQRQCARRLALLRRDLYALTARATRHDQRRWAVGVLASVGDLDPAPADPRAEAHLRDWLTELAAAVPPPPALRPDTRTAQALLLVRIAAVEAEAATLGHLLLLTK